MKKISIIIPYYNAHLFIDDLLISIEKQSCRDALEVIIINDGSDRDSKCYLQEVTKKYNSINIHVIHQENLGVSAARNAGLAIASGEYIAFIDADDMLCGRYSIECRAEYLINNINVDVVGGYNIKIDECGRVIPTRVTSNVEPIISQLTSNPSRFAELYLDYYLNRKKIFLFIAGGTLIRKKSIPNIYFKSDYDKVEDIKFTIDLLVNKKTFTFLKIPVYLKRSHDSQLHFDTPEYLENTIIKDISAAKKILKI